MNRKSLVAIAVVLGGTAIWLNFPSSGSSHTHHSKNSSNKLAHIAEKSGKAVITQNVIKETTVIKEPKIKHVSPLPELSPQDIQYLNNEKEEEDLIHETAMEKLKATKAKYISEQAKLSGKSSDIKNITGGAVPSSTMKVAVTEDVIDKHKKLEDEFVRKQVFSGIKLASLHADENGTADAYLLVNGGYEYVKPGDIKGDFKVEKITADSITLKYIPKGYIKRFSMSGISFKERPVVKPTSSVKKLTLPPISVQRIKSRYKKAHRK